MKDLKQKSISQMTIPELIRLNRRLEQELDIERLIMEVKRNNGERWTNETRPIVDTTTPIEQLYPQHDDIFKNKSISELTKEELNMLQERLRHETRAQNKILDLKRHSGEDWDWEDSPSVSTDTPVNQLYHHGVLGMKWGVRKKNQTTTSPKGKARNTTTEVKDKKPKSEDFMESRILKSKASAGLSNVELKRLNERLNLEKQYKDLTKEEREKGKSYLSDSLTSGLKQTATTVVAASSLYAVKKLIEKSMGSAAAAEMFPPSKKK